MSPSVRLVCASGVALLGGCGLFEDPPDRDPPELLEIKLVETNTIRLTFSQYISDPHDLEIGVFRLSAAIAHDGVTDYYALDATDDDLDAGSTDSGTSSGGDSTTSVGIAEPDGAGDRIAGDREPNAVLDPVIRSVSKPLDPYADPIGTELDIELFDALGDLPGCARLRGIPLSDGAVFLHYRPGQDAAITDTAGNRVAPLAARWVAHDELAFEEVEGRFPDQPRPSMPIPCP
jgi:hypothetical protein